MTPLNGLFLDAGSVDAGDVDLGPLQRVLELQCRDQTAAEDLINQAAGHAVLITNKCPIGRAAFAALDALKLVCVAATGVDIIDLQAARDHGVTVCNCRDYATASVAEHTLALMLTLNSRLQERRQRVYQGDWSRSSHFALLEPRVAELSGQKLGVVGFGHLGQAVARRASALGMEVQASERPVSDTVRKGRIPFEQVLAESDVVTLHCPLTPETRGLINETTLNLMKPGALLINTARGALVVVEDLLAALDSGHLGGAALDVLESEPPAEDHPLLKAERPNLWVTPHCAWATTAARQRLIDQLAGLVQAFAAGQPINRVV